MKVTTSERPPQPRPDYPYLAQGLPTGSIWLVTGPRKSILIVPEGVRKNNPVGTEWTYGFISTLLTPFSGTVTLSND